jgi:predicted amidohydrolase
LPGRKWFAKYYNSAVAIPSPEFNIICDVAKENNVFLSIGIIEKEGGTLYCTSILLDRKGDLASSHRKVRIYQPQTRLKVGKLTRES